MRISKIEKKNGVKRDIRKKREKKSQREKERDKREKESVLEKWTQTDDSHMYPF